MKFRERLPELREIPNVAGSQCIFQNFQENSNNCSLLLIRRFFAVRYFRFSHCAAFIISSPGRGLSFSLCCLSPSPFFVDYVPFSTEYRSFRSASSIACARKKEKGKKGKKEIFLSAWVFFLFSLLFLFVFSVA